MFARKPNPAVVELNKAITTVHAHLDVYPPTSPEYAAAADQLVKLYAQKKEIPSPRWSPDALIAVGGNIAVVLTIVAYEQRNAWTTKAGSFVQKPFR